MEHANLDITKNEQLYRYAPINASPQGTL